jgi:CHAT domain-containing protein
LSSSTILSVTSLEILAAAQGFFDTEFSGKPGDRHVALENILQWLARIMISVAKALTDAAYADKPFVILPFGILSQFAMHATYWLRDGPNKYHFFFHPRYVSFAYSARSLVESRRRAAQSQGRTALIVNNPKPLPPTYDPLYLADAEGALVQAYFPHHRMFRGAEATSQRLDELLPGADLVHCVCHGTVDQRMKQCGVLLLAKSQLYTYVHIRSLTELKARLVVLSACRSGAAPRTIEHVLNLPNAFLSAGAASVIGTFWHTDEISSLLLLTKFYELWCHGRPVADALGCAQEWLMRAREATQGKSTRKRPVVSGGNPACRCGCRRDRLLAPVVLAGVLCGWGVNNRGSMEMAMLPVEYMKVVRNLTGYWGTYLPSKRVAPGMIGKVVDGTFIQEGHIQKMPGYEPEAHGTDSDPNQDDETRWITAGVKIALVSGRAKAGGIPISMRMKLQFTNANEAVVVCRQSSQTYFESLAAIKALLRNLKEKNQWDRESCLVTHVFEVDSALVLFSTAGNQSAELEAAASLPELPEPLTALQATKVSLVASVGKSQFGGFYAELPKGATPLFQAIRFNQSRWWQSAPSEFGFLRGDPVEFEEPPFGTIA